MKFGAFASLVSLVTAALSVQGFKTPSPLPGSADIEVRDPTLAYNPKTKKYFTFSTQEGIKIFSAKHLTGPWERVGSVLPNCSVVQLPGNCTIWAPDVNYINGEYVIYYSVSTIGSQNSAIGLATSKTMEPGDWVDHGAVLTSTPNGPFNAIDANIISDDNGMHLTFGSYWEGIFQVPLRDLTTVGAPTPGTHIAGGSGRPAEGATIYKPKYSPYYFALFSDGITPFVGATQRPEPGKEYKVLVGRAKSPRGPFFDKEGRDISLDNTAGTLVLGSHDNVYAPGGQSVTRDPVSGREVIVYHYVPNDKFGGPSYLGINYIDFSSGWPVVVY